MLRKALMIAASLLEAPVRKSDRLVRLLADELKSEAPLPFWQRLRAFRQGYVSQSVLMYGMTEENRHLFVSDYQRAVRTPDINGSYRMLLKDKLLFNLMTQVFPDLHIPAHGLIDNGVVLYPDYGEGDDPLRYIAELLDQKGMLVLKPTVGGGGAKIFFVARSGAGFTIDERPMDASEFGKWLGSLQRNLVSDFITQCPELAALYPRTTNTVRLLTMWDPSVDEPFVAAGLMRIGNAASYPVDNVMAGALAAAIDLASGTLSKAVSIPRKNEPTGWFSAHPESGTQIEGMAIPHWDRILATMLDVCRHLPYLPYVGWDIIVTADGFKLVEGNHYPGLFPIQAHGPLLADPRVARFYKAHGVV